MQNTHTSGRVPAPTRRDFRPRLEVLEDRSVPALAVTDLTGGLTAQALAQSLAGSGVAISNVTYTGTNTSAGEFSGGTGIIGFESGIILSTGTAKGVIGPNKSDSTSTTLGTPGDPQLDAIVAPNVTDDATVLQ